MKQVAVIGLGRFGMSVVRNLCSFGGCEVLAVDIDEKQVHHAAETATYAVQADATDEATLKSLGLKNFDFVVVAIGTDIQASVIITLSLKDLGVGNVIAKAQSHTHGRILEKAGADRVVYPERDMGARLAKSILTSNIVDFIELSPEYSIVELSVPYFFKGKSLAVLNARAQYGVNIIAIKRGEEIIVSPQASDTIMPDDIMVVVGKNSDIAKLEL